MSNRLPIIGEYPPDWPEINAAVCEAVGHRCIRCGHPYRKGENGTGEWSQCDYLCRHPGPLAILWKYAHNDKPTLQPVDDATASFHRRNGMAVFAAWRILTVHHLDGNKANCSWWNLLALCQRCHLTIQGNVKPNLPYFLEHSDWFKPYVAGFYAKKYEGLEITREEAMTRIKELLKYERLA